MLTDRLNFYVDILQDILQDILNDLELNDIWGFLSTQTALAVYVIVLLASVLFLWCRPIRPPAWCRLWARA